MQDQLLPWNLATLFNNELSHLIKVALGGGKVMRVDVTILESREEQLRWLSLVAVGS